MTHPLLQKAQAAKNPTERARWLAAWKRITSTSAPAPSEKNEPEEARPYCFTPPRLAPPDHPLQRQAVQKAQRLFRGATILHSSDYGTLFFEVMKLLAPACDPLPPESKRPLVVELVGRIWETVAREHPDPTSPAHDQIERMWWEVCSWPEESWSLPLVPLTREQARKGGW